MKLKTLTSLLATSLLLVGCGGNTHTWPKEVAENIKFSLGDYEIPFFEAASYDSTILDDGDNTLVIYCYQVAEDADEVYTATLESAGFETEFYAAYGVYLGRNYINETEYISIEYGLFLGETEEEGLLLIIYAWLAEDVEYSSDSWPTDLVESLMTYDVPAFTGTDYAYFYFIQEDDYGYYLEIMVVGTDISLESETAYANLLRTNGWSLEPYDDGGYLASYNDTTFVEFWLFDQGLMVINLWDNNWY